jgi:hypothetical protein
MHPFSMAVGGTTCGGNGIFPTSCSRSGADGVTVTKDGSAVMVAGYKGADPEGTENDDAVLARLPL